MERALHDLERALRALGMSSSSGDLGSLTIRTDKGRLTVTVETAVAPGISKVGELMAPTQDGAGEDRTQVLVADRLSLGARVRLREQGWGWLDRRGHLRLWAPAHGIRIETEIEPLRTSRGPEYEDVLATGVGIDVAIALLLEPDRTWSVRTLATKIERAPSAVSVALARFRGSALVTETNQPLLPDLFSEVAGSWAPRRVALARAPQPGEGASLRRMQFNIDDATVPGWALTDTLAAREYGAPVVVGSAYPPDFYVPSPTVLRDAASYFGEASSFESRGCTVSVPPSGVAVSKRLDVGAALEFLLAHPLFVALELARDKARGREILDRWNPPEGFARVW